MLKIENTAIFLDPEEVMDLERIALDDDREEALKFVKKIIYKKAELAQKSYGEKGPAGRNWPGTDN